MLLLEETREIPLQVLLYILLRITELFEEESKWIPSQSFKKTLQLEIVLLSADQRPMP